MEIEMQMRLSADDWQQNTILFRKGTNGLV